MSDFKLEFAARAYGKVNLHLGVGEARDDGYHELATVFQAVDRPETVTLRVNGETDRVLAGSVVESMSTTFHVNEPDEDIDGPNNLAWRAVDAVVERYRDRAKRHAVDLPRVRLFVDKTIFVAGGMAGGSADAAAALIAANEYLEYWTSTSLTDDDNAEIASSLGADVPFCLMGGTALGRGRGDKLAPMMARGTYWWAFVSQKEGLSTGRVFEYLDELRHNDPALVPRLDTTAIARALVSGEPATVAGVLHNDLQPAAVKLHPNLRNTLHEARLQGVLRAIVSGSGPTVAILCENEEHARKTVDALTSTVAYEGFAARGPAPAAHSLTAAT
ncbi:4-(cytidine 5'-diphospho)-2-C-methyl-D-erythritol kinase [Corynebacterium breve]|uniref:4-diphosphocytidyl-2-C-methyl-D-erythritol kinase n=1 Tax=Corynebacterium breve TaxID=3049799 RepID=A0ABY8VG18_9CORY|nr:4-(cytidine 5'-diphospho)-2-C-methyl-D-erythritol kinase [Corynebacterium breve]WIM68443.1 4-(cytidine 5'-diphospho)-2-C-methyl-D-erythritol kinase [Corynebacterium breve]